MNPQDLSAIARGDYEVRQKMAAKIKALKTIASEYRQVIEEMDKEIRRLMEDK